MLKLNLTQNLHYAFCAFIIYLHTRSEEVLTMISVGVGRAIVTSYEKIASQEVYVARWKKALASHEVGRKGLIARFFLGIRF